ncbi:MAG TPA: hypothetical protein VFG64_15415 [Dongiaceae bacterium]|nr:hypothetical protein [Dongiaceae bacterium]
MEALLQAAGRAHQAENVERLKSILEEILEIDPDHPKVLYNLGIVHRDRDEIFAAEVCLRRAIKLDPGMIDAYQALADLLFTAKHLLPAAALYEQALEKAPNRLPLLQNLSRTRLMMKDAPEAERHARRILSIDEKSSEAWATLAWALLYRNVKSDEALRAAEEAMRLSVEARHAPALLEEALRRAGRDADADALWAALLKKAAASQDTTRNLTEAYYWLDRLDRCRELTQTFIAANPENLDGLKDLSALMMADGEFQLAQEVLDRAASIAPDHGPTRMVRGLNAFRLGDYQLGLSLYESRWQRSTYDRRWEIPLPDWDGQPIDGGLVVYSEQGIGDYVMFALLFPELRKYAKSIVIEVNARVASLFRRTFPDMAVVDRNALPADWDPGRYRAKVAMGDLLLLLGADIENLPNRAGFLVPEPSLTLKLRNRYRAMFPGKRLVGISWRSGNRDSATIRSIDLGLWKPIFETADCAFISLQYGDNTRDLEMLRSATGHVVHWDREIDPMQYLDPLTAQIAAMDLIISVDNSTVHFAGAVGTPCWVLLPVNSDWRWLVERTSSIWYDSLHLWRQQISEGWEQVIAQVAVRLREIGRDPLIDAQAEMCLRCGEELLRREAIPQAEEYFRWLLETGRHKAAAFHGIGMAARNARKFQDSAAILGRAAELAPERVNYKADWLVALFEAGHHDTAERLMRDLTRQSNDAAVLMAMGHVLAAKGLLDQATDYFARILRSEPRHLVARATLAGLQAAQGEDELAHRNFTRLIQQAPDLAGSRAALAELDLRHERDEAAWPNFAWRFGTAPDELPRHLAMIAPDDRPKSLAGDRIRRRRLFLRAERNTVEQILFAPWIADALRDARSVRAECDAATMPLLSSAFAGVRFAAAGTLAPADLVTDRIQIAGSLGDLISTYPRISDGGWLPFDRAQAARRRSRFLDDGPETRVVGLAWRPTGTAQGGLEAFAALFQLEGIRWVAVPMGPVSPAMAQLLAAPGGPMIFESAWLQDGLQSIADRLAALDLLISSEDLAATLAGAAGKPVWKVAAAGDHWSWLAEGGGSRWHPTARIYRAGDIAATINDMRVDLGKFAGTHSGVLR